MPKKGKTTGTTIMKSQLMTQSDQDNLRKLINSVIYPPKFTDFPPSQTVKPAAPFAEC
jgi:hypothetical protein